MRSHGKNTTTRSLTRRWRGERATLRHGDYTLEATGSRRQDGLHQVATDGGQWWNNKFNASEHEEVPTRTHDGNTKSNIRCEHGLDGKW